MKKVKPCRLCGGKRVGRLTICYKCFLKREQTKRELKIAKLKNRKKIKKEKIKNSYRYLHKVADKLFSRYVRMKGCDKNGFDVCFTCGTRLHWKKMKTDKLKESLEDMVCQFAYQGKDKKGLPAYWTGGLSALEGAFSVLGWKDPYPCPENKCKYGKCKEWATCGTPTKNGYKRVCFKHYQIIEKEEKSG